MIIYVAEQGPHSTPVFVASYKHPSDTEYEQLVYLKKSDKNPLNHNSDLKYRVQNLPISYIKDILNP